MDSLSSYIDQSPQLKIVKSRVASYLDLFIVTGHFHVCRVHEFCTGLKSVKSHKKRSLKSRVPISPAAARIGSDQNVNILQAESNLNHFSSA